MFGMVLATGIRILARADYNSNRHNLYIVAISLGVGMIPTVSGHFFQHFPLPCNRCFTAASCWPPSARCCSTSFQRLPARSAPPAEAPAGGAVRPPAQPQPGKPAS